MSQERIPFRITDLQANVPEGVPVLWQGQEFSSGPLFIELDETLDERGNQGMLDYDQRYAQAEFHVRVHFPEFAAILDDLGVDPELTRPVQAVLHSEGQILDDHSFAFSGSSELRPHTLLTQEDTWVCVLPGQ